MPTFDALGVVAADLGATLAFYRMLGLDVPEGGEGHVEAEVAGGFRVMFDSLEVVQSFSDHVPPSGDGRGVAFAFRCESPAEVDAVYATVTGAGHRGKTEPFDAVWGQRYATVLDPDGNPVDLYAALA
jgi:uncharacterized glyoxalase superfamily protein PhnB